MIWLLTLRIACVKRLLSLLCIVLIIIVIIENVVELVIRPAVSSVNIIIIIAIGFFFFSNYRYLILERVSLDEFIVIAFILEKVDTLMVMRLGMMMICN